MIKKYFKIILLICLVALVVMPHIVFADNAAQTKLEEVGVNRGNGPYQPADVTSMSEIVGTAVSAFLALIGVIFLVLMVYAGFNWMIARGDEEKVTKAKDTITRAIIGIIIVVGAWAIWVFVYSWLIE